MSNLKFRPFAARELQILGAVYAARAGQARAAVIAWLTPKRRARKPRAASPEIGDGDRRDMLIYT